MKGYNCDYCPIAIRCEKTIGDICCSLCKHNTHKINEEPCSDCVSGKGCKFEMREVK